jgi:mersacidin/lichenicidin family type 2 lantibiotic
MKPEQIIRAWKDENYRRSLSDAERAQLPANPAGKIDLTDAQLEQVVGGGGKKKHPIETSAICDLTKSGTICTITKTCGEITKGCTVYIP